MPRSMRFAQGLLSFVLTVMIGFAGAAYAQAPALTPENLPQLYTNAMAARDVEAIGGFYAERAILMTPEGPVAGGRDQIKALLARNFAAGAVRMTVNQARRDGDANHAVVIMDWLLEIAPAGREPLRRRVRSLFYMRSTGSNWQIVADMYQAFAPN